MIASFGRAEDAMGAIYRRLGRMYKKGGSPMDSNGFYYTLSTIAQTLAGLFGILIAVSVFNISIMYNTVIEKLRDIKELSDDLDEKEYNYNKISIEIDLIN